MANKQNRKRGRQGKFNRASGMHSYKAKKRTLEAKYKISELNNIKCHPYKINKMKNVSTKLILSKIVLKKAIKYVCMRTFGRNKLYLKRKENNIEGNRVMNLDKLKCHVNEMTMHTAICEKARDNALNNKNVLSLESEKRNGFYSLLNFKCCCGKVFHIDNSDKFGETELQDINVRMVWGSMVTGGGASSLNELVGTGGIPGLSDKKFSCIEQEIGRFWHTILQEEMCRAGQEEKSIAIAEDSYFQGVPAIEVICDGGWSKRSHKHTYNAMAGVAVIFGARTKKILHIGIRNKLCYICSTAQTQNKEPAKHDCYRNWEESAQAMESDIILEGFLKCESVHGLRYMKMVCDGDSSVYANIIKHVPVWGPHVQKIECANHATKCLRVHLEHLVSEKPHYKGKGGLTKAKITQITCGVRCAIVMRSAESTKTGKKLECVKKLKQDIKNAGRHVLGFHDLCSTDFCKHKKRHTVNETFENIYNFDDDNEEDIIINQCDYWKDCVRDLSNEEVTSIRYGGKTQPTKINENLLKDIFLFLNRLAEKSDRLIGNYTSNLAESWMHIKSKFEGGKMFNKCFRGSFFARCYGGALRTMFGPAWSPQVYIKITGNRPDSVFLQTYNDRARKYRNTKKSQQNPVNVSKRKNKKLKSSQSNSKKSKVDYGLNVLDDSEDISLDNLQVECDAYFENNLKKSNKDFIEKSTRGQTNNVIWHQERNKRLTSSFFGEVLSRSINNNSPNLVKRILYSKFKGNMFTLKGLNEEENARIEYINLKNKENKRKLDIQIPGLIIDKEESYLAASSDGIVLGKDGPEGLIEIKTLLQNKKTLIEEAAKSEKSFCLTYKNGTMELKRNHKYFYQIQGQLNILDMDWCDLIIRRVNPHDIYIQRINKDRTLWTEIMVPKLKAFYFTHMLPELAVPRNGTVSGIRKPTLPWFKTKNRANNELVTSAKYKTGRSDISTVQSEVKSTHDTSTEEPSDKNIPLSINSTSSRKRCRRVKFVGRRISHQWTEADNSNKWYTGVVLAVVKGKDGDKNAVYQVQYDNEDDSYDVDSLQNDHDEGTLKFIDI